MNLQKMANAVRMLSVDMISAANSGHPGACLGMADFTTVLWAEFLKFDPLNPNWENRDRFLMSNAHAGPMQYALLYLTGYPDITLDDLKKFRQIDSKTTGHPEVEMLSGVEATGGPLGQGLAMAVGMALAARLSGRDHYTYVTIGDGCLMEGVSEEAISLAGHLKLNKLIAFWDNNRITIDGSVDIATSVNQKMRFEACGWNVIEIDGHDYNQIRVAIQQAQLSDKPTLISCRTIIGYGCSKAGTSACHGSPLKAEEVVELRKNLGWEYEPFVIPEDVQSDWKSIGQKNTSNTDAKKNVIDWTEFEKYKAQLLVDRPEVASRKSSQMALTVLADLIPNLIGGSADLSASNLTKTPKSIDITDEVNGNYINYGIREFAMGCIMNGIALYGGFIPYGGTFFVFADYLKPAMRLSCLMGQQVIYVLTHDSIGVGEDGPTHQPVEQLAMLRSIPNMTTIRPADALECAEAWEIAIRNNTPTALILSRQNLPFISQTSGQTDKGAYVVSDCEKPKLTIIATGSEVALALKVSRELSGIRVVSMPSWELFKKQPLSYQQEVLGNVVRVSLEAGTTFGWKQWADECIGIDTFGFSGPGNKVFDKVGLNVDNVIDKIKKILNIE